MKYLAQEKFVFQSDAAHTDTFGVVRFTGTEGLSQIYRFDITLVADDPNLDLKAILKKRAAFTIFRPDGSEVRYNGIIAQCNITSQVGDFFLYQVVLVPALWVLTLSHHNHIFLDQNPEQIITVVLKNGGLSTLNFEFRLKGSYVTWDYCCQYGESHYDFISRWMERNGIYYFFEQGENREKIIFTDSVMAHVPSILGKELTYSPVSGLETLHLEEAVQTCICEQQNVPHTVKLKDYNYRKPSLNISGNSQVSEDGIGTMYYYGDHFRTAEEGNKIAKIRSQELLCNGEQYHCESTVPYIISGYQFQLKNHFRSAMNRGYLTIQSRHTGNQVSYLLAGLREQLTVGEEESLYHNSFTAIPDDVQFRSARKTEQPRLLSTITARIDGAGTGKYAEIDEHGRYKVILPFDQSGRKDGKASAWIRMMQPYAGDGHGMHFPLHKGTEVLLTFIDGNPDRPIIAGAVPNAETASIVDSKNSTRAGFKSAGGSSFYTEDSESHERLVMKSGDGQSSLRLGSGSDNIFGAHSDAIFLAGAGGAGIYAMFDHYDFSIRSNLVMTGGKMLALLTAIQKFLTDKSSDISEEGKNTKFSTETLLLITEAIVILAKYRLKAKLKKTKLKNSKELMPSLNDPAFCVFSHGKNTYVLNNAKGDDIFLATDKGQIITSSNTNTELHAGADMNISGANCNMDADGGKITLKADKIALIKPGTNPQYPKSSIKIEKDISIATSSKGDIIIHASESLRMGSNWDHISIDKNGHVVVKSDGNGGIVSIFAGSELTGNQNKIELTETGIGITGMKFSVASKAGNKIDCDATSARLTGNMVEIEGTTTKMKGKTAVVVEGGVVKIG